MAISNLVIKLTVPLERKDPLVTCTTKRMFSITVIVMVVILKKLFYKKYF